MADQMDVDIDIDNSLTEAIQKASETKFKSSKSHGIYTTTLKTPPFAYAHLEIISATNNTVLSLDELTVRQYLTSALKQFLGITGTAMPIDIMKVSGRQAWVRLPRQDLGAFAAAMTAWVGTGSSISGFRICAAGDWLGALIGRYDQRRIWGES